VTHLSRPRSPVILAVLWLSVAAGRAHTPNQIPSRLAGVRRTFPQTEFYATPTPLPPGKPGELIRAQEFDEYTLGDGVNAVRILYHSRAADGEDVAASGVVLFPDGQVPSGGWPVIAWAHAENGVARDCAPSLARNLHNGPFLAMYVNLGYAVVASDYAGLGTSFRHAFADMQSNATDVLHSVPAARAAVPQLGVRWVVMGDGAGGMTVAAVAELEQDIRDPNYLGGIVLSGLDDLQNIYHRSTGTVGGDMALSLAYGIKTLYPQFEVGKILTEKALSAYQQMSKTCGDASAQSRHTAAEMLRPDWERNHFASQYLSRNRPGQKPGYGPLLVISGTQPDQGNTTAAVARMCRQGDQVQFDQYLGSNAGQVLGDSVTEQIAWIRARFAGKPAPSNCYHNH